MTTSFTLAVAKRGLHLGIAYVVLSSVLVVFAIGFSAVGGTFARNSAPLPGGVVLSDYLALFGVPFLALGGLLASVPVSLLFVHDKDNGTLEYLLSLGFDQRDVFRAYLGAALLLGAPLVFVGGVAAAVADLALGLGASLAGTVILGSYALGLSTIALVAVLMSAFSSLQRQPVGMNQPLGIAIGAFLIMAPLIAGAVARAYQVVLELAFSAIVVVISLSLLAISPRLIRREKMLP